MRIESGHSSELKMVGSMTAEIAHEIRGLLNIISTSNEILSEAILRGDLELASKHSNKIKRIVERISKTVKGVRYIAHNSDGKEFARNSVNEIIADAVTLCEVLLRKRNILLKVDYATPDVQLECRSNEILQILMNLMENAIDVVESSHKPWIELKCVCSADSIEFLVSSSGTSAGSEIRSKIPYR